MKGMPKKILKWLKQLLTKNVGYKIMAIIFAIILWLVVVNIQNPASTRTFYNIPVSIINEDSVLDGDHTYKIVSGNNATITVAGTRSVLGNLSASDFEAVADFSSLSITNAAPISVSLISEKARYENQIDITLRTVSMVIEVEDLITEEYPVAVNYSGFRPENFSIDKIELSPSTVSVSGPASVMETISGVGIMVSYDEVMNNESLETELRVYDNSGNEMGVDDRVTLGSDVVTAQFISYDTKTVPVTIEAFGTPASGYELKGITLSRPEVEIKGTAEALAAVDKIELPSSLLNIANKTSSVSATVDLSEYVPENVSFSAAAGGNYYVMITAEIERSEPETTTSDRQPATSESKTTTGESKTATGGNQTVSGGSQTASQTEPTASSGNNSET